MSKKFTESQREVFKRLVLDCILQRLTTDESLDYINTKLKAKYDIEIGPDYIKHIKMELRQDSQKELSHLRKNRLSYMNHLFFDRIDEVKNMQRKLWEIITSNQEEKPDVAIRSISELHKLSQSLYQMYEMLPFLGNLPSNAFTGLVDNDNDDNGGGGGGEVDHVDKESVTAVVSSSQQKPIPPSSYVGGNSRGMYNLRHDID
jgi:hypothetical protein